MYKKCFKKEKKKKKRTQHQDLKVAMWALCYKSKTFAIKFSFSLKNRITKHTNITRKVYSSTDNQLPLKKKKKM